MRICVSIAVVIAAGCTPGEVIPDRTDTDQSTGSECGDPVHGLSLTFVGLVQDANDDPVEGTTLTLEDRSILPAVDLGSATSGPDGEFTLVANDITDLPGCWLTALDYTLVAVAEYGEVERFVNREMYTALDGNGVVDLRQRPLQLVP